MSAVALDTHVAYWLWAGETSKISGAAHEALAEAHDLLVAAISWYELALLFERGRIELVDTTAAAVLDAMAERVTTAPLSRQIAARAAELERAREFPRDPADRLIFATARQLGVRLVSADEKIRSFSREVCVW